MVICSSAEHMKKMKYEDAVEARHATFTPFVVSVDGVQGEIHISYFHYEWKQNMCVCLK